MAYINFFVRKIEKYKTEKNGRYLILITFLFGFSVVAQTELDLKGTWIIDSTFENGGYSEVVYTPEGKVRAGSYNFLTDDPSLQCIPSGLGRIWGSPGSPIEIQQLENTVLIHYEMFDLRRTVWLNRRGHSVDALSSVVNLKDQAMPTMGNSIGWYEDDILVIETLAYSRGYVTTLGQAIPQSAAMRSIERLYRDGDRLAIEVTYIDPIVFQEPLTRAYRFKKSPFPVILYGCEF